MRKAIDYYAIGKQREVTAWAGESVSANSNRFFCPECMESVALDIRGHFRHKNKTPQSIECEKRVDSPTRTAYEKMGLSLYLTKTDDSDSFKLNIGFPAIDDYLLFEAAMSNSFFTINNLDSAPSKYYISSARFNSEHYTLIPVDSTPRNGSRYNIFYSEATPTKICDQWTKYSDYWGIGQFYKCGNENSRKVRQLGSLVAEQEYYFTGNINIFNKYRQIISVENSGFLILRNQKLRIYKMCIHCENKYMNLFKMLSFMLMEKFKVNLLIKESSIEPLWPPCIIDDNYYIFDSQYSKAMFYVNSPNDIPTVYRYYNHSNIELTVAGDGHILSIPLSDFDIPISVDKVFNGDIQYIRRKKISPDSDFVSVDVVTSTGTPLEKANIMNISTLKVFITANTQCLIHVMNPTSSRVFKVTNNNPLQVQGFNWGDIITVYSMNMYVLWKYVFNKSDLLPLNNTSIDFSKYDYSPHIQIDAHIRHLLSRIGPNDYTKKYLLLNKIPKELALVLFKLEKEGSLC